MIVINKEKLKDLEIALLLLTGEHCIEYYSLQSKIIHLSC